MTQRADRKDIERNDDNISFAIVKKTDRKPSIIIGMLNVEDRYPKCSF